MGAADIYRAASKLDGDDRTNYINEACGANENLKSQVLKMLAKEDLVLPCDNLFDSKNARRFSLVDQPLSVEAKLKPGVEVNGYELVKKVGQGSFGVVWKAKQSKPTRFVAIKFFNFAYDSEVARKRFQLEVQATALMNHSNVVSLHETGVFDDKFYTVMELVEGEKKNLTEYCNDKRLGVVERLDVFKGICAGVHHAHHSGVIHRDLKPVNILVADIDQKHTPKVVDFGLAKSIDKTLELTSDPRHTMKGLGTPMYSSPEQLTLGHVDERSDVYSLGVILYELMTGSHPYGLDGSEMNGAQVSAWIKEKRLIRPSDRIQRHGVVLDEKTKAGELRSSLKGSLDYVIMKAMEPDPLRRYESVSEFADDIKRYLNDEAVIARPRSSFYELQLFSKRNPWLVTTATISTFLLIVSLIAVVIAWNSAVSERDYATAIADFVKDDFFLLASDRGREIYSNVQGFPIDRDSGLSELLDRAAHKLELRRDLKPLVKAELLFILGRNYFYIGNHERAIQLLEQSKSLTPTDLNDRSIDLKATLALAYGKSYELGKCLEMLEACHRDSVKVFGVNAKRTNDIIHSLAVCHTWTGDYEKAEQLLSAVVARRAENPSFKKNEDTLITDCWLASVWLKNGKIEKSLNRFLELNKEPGMSLSVRLSNHTSISEAYLETGDIPKAIAVARIVVKTATERLSPTNSFRVESQARLASLLLKDGQQEEAVAIADEVTAQLEAAGLTNNLGYTDAGINFAVIYREAGMPKRALPWFELAYALAKKCQFQHPSSSSATFNLAVCFADLHRFDEAIPLFEKNYGICMKRYGKVHEKTTVACGSLVRVHFDSGKFDGWIKWQNKGFALSFGRYGESDVGTIEAMRVFAGKLAMAGLAEEGIETLQSALKITEEHLNEDHLLHFKLIAELANANAESKDFDEARRLYLHFIEESARVNGKDHVTTLVGKNNLGWFHRRIGEFDRARELFRQAQAAYEAKYSSNHPEALKAMNNIASIHWSEKNYELAVPILEKVVKRANESSQRNSEHTLNWVVNLAVNYKALSRFDEAIPLLQEVDKHTKRFPNLSWIKVELLECYLKSNHPKAASFLDEIIAEIRDGDGPKKLKDRKLRLLIKELSVHKLDESAELVRNELNKTQD